MTGAGLAIAFLLGMAIVLAVDAVKSGSSVAVIGSTLSLSGLFIASLSINQGTLAVACAASLVAIALARSILGQEGRK